MSVLRLKSRSICFWGIKAYRGMRSEDNRVSTILAKNRIFWHIQIELPHVHDTNFICKIRKIVSVIFNKKIVHINTHFYRDLIGIGSGEWFKLSQMINLLLMEAPRHLFTMSSPCFTRLLIKSLSLWSTFISISYYTENSIQSKICRKCFWLLLAVHAQKMIFIYFWSKTLTDLS